MSINIGDNFKYLGKKFLDDRESFATLEEMKNCVMVPDGFVTYCKEDGKRYEFNSSNIINELTGQWVEFSAKGIGDGAGHHVGTEAPENETDIWFFDGTEMANNETTYDNPVVAELFACIQSLQDQITRLQADVEYLKINGGGGIPNEPDIPNTYLKLEDGSYLVLEDGGYFILEESINALKGGIMLLENGAELLLESGYNILFES